MPRRPAPSHRSSNVEVLEHLTTFNSGYQGLSDITVSTFFKAAYLFCGNIYEKMASTTTPGVYINPTTKKKTFVPLENNPEVFNDLIKRLGITSKVGFYDVYGIEPELLSMVPRPVHALIFISPAPVWNNVRKTYDGYDGNEKQVTYDAAGDGEPVMWFRQTIGRCSASCTLPLLILILMLLRPCMRAILTCSCCRKWLRQRLYPQGLSH